MIMVVIIIYASLVIVRSMSDAGSDDLDEERVQDLGVRMCSI